MVTILPGWEGRADPGGSARAPHHAAAPPRGQGGREAGRGQVQDPGEPVALQGGVIYY